MPVAFDTSPRLFKGAPAGFAGGPSRGSSLEVEAHTRRGGLLSNEGEDYDDGRFNVDDQSGACCGCFRFRRR